MDFSTIDWNALWQADTGHSCWNRTPQKDLWNRRAESFNKSINRVVEGKEGLDKGDYISKMLERIEVKPGWSVLDIGSGPGTLAIPLAKKARSVTTLDISVEMLKHLKANAARAGLDNIRYINSSWQDAFAGQLVGEHDVIVASRSLMSGDIEAAASYIIRIAAQAVYLTFPVVHLPFDWEVYKAIGREGKKHPPYIYFYNLLYRKGIMANVEILHSRIKVQFSGIDECIESLQWRTEPFTAEERTKLTAFLKEKFERHSEGGIFSHEGYSQWALIWWKQGEQSC